MLTADVLRGHILSLPMDLTNTYEANLRQILFHQKDEDDFELTIKHDQFE